MPCRCHSKAEKLQKRVFSIIKESSKEISSELDIEERWVLAEFLFWSNALHLESKGEVELACPGE